MTYGVCQAQTKVLEASDQCVITEFLLPKHLNSEELKSKKREIGKFETAKIGEGREIRKIFRINNSKFFAIASVFYDDDKELNDTLTDTITITLVVSRTKKLRLPSTISVGKTQIQYDENFTDINVETMAHYGNKLFDFSMRCSKKQRP